MSDQQDAKTYREAAAAIREMAARLLLQQGRADALVAAAAWDLVAAQIELGDEVVTFGTTACGRRSQAMSLTVNSLTSTADCHE